MAIDYAVKYQDDLGQLFTQGSLTGELETTTAKFEGAKSIKIPNLALTALKRHDRTGGYNKGVASVTHETMEMMFDRDIQFNIDSEDIDETNQALSVANVTAVYSNEHVNPEIDAYRFSKLATEAVTNGNSAELDVTTADAKTVYSALRADLAKVRKYGVGTVVCYVTSDVMSAVEEAKAIAGTVDLGNAGTAIETRVTQVDGVKLVEVFDEGRFYDSFNFDEGFVTETGSKKINWLVVSKKAILAKVKAKHLKVFKPSENQQGDGYLFQLRVYHDIFVYDNAKDGVRVNLDPTAQV